VLLDIVRLETFYRVLGPGDYVLVSVERDSVSGDTVLFLQGTNGVSLYYPRYADGMYAINVLQ
jgi:hypothetical protein